MREKGPANGLCLKPWPLEDLLAVFGLVILMNEVPFVDGLGAVVLSQTSEQPGHNTGAAVSFLHRAAAMNCASSDLPRPGVLLASTSCSW